jgi:glycerate 2-kinase
MPRSTEQLRRDLLEIFTAGVDAVRSDRLARQALRIENDSLLVVAPGSTPIPLNTIDRIAVVGAGKAGAGMASAVEEVLGPRIIEEHRVTGWVNVPENCVRALSAIHLHGARPAGVNEPTAAGVAGAEEILRIVDSLGPRDLCLCLISGGGSALAPLPAEGITLQDKLAVTRHLSAAGAAIEQLNTVRKQLSRIKGGGLLRACRAGRLVTLVISDVLGDPLDLIASGPTVPNQSTPQQALDILDQFHAREAGIPERIFSFLANKAVTATRPSSCVATNVVIGNNATAVEAAGRRASELGYRPTSESATRSEGLAEDVGRQLAERALRMSIEPGPDCLISGGEPVVRLVGAAHRGLGGRNQQLVLAALIHLTGRTHCAMLSGGTDGEDGPTDAAGALFDDSIIAAAAEAGLAPADYLARNDAYHFFEPLGGLIKTGPTDTNVCDLRVVLVDGTAGP